MGGFKVLIVDDEADFRETLLKRLSRRGLSVSGAESGENALERIAEESFDVVLLDMRMTGLDGIATLREIKRKKPLLEVILLTGHASLEAGIEGLRLGAFDFIVKPAELEELIRKLQQAYDKKSAHEEKIRAHMGGDH